MRWFSETRGGGRFPAEMLVISTPVDIQNAAERADVMLETKFMDSI